MSSEADGDKFMEALAENAEFDSLHSLTIADEWRWFKDGRDGCIDSLVTLIARQHELKFLDLHWNEITEEHQQLIRSAVVSPDCRVIITREEYKAYQAELKQAKAEQLEKAR